MKKPVPFYDMFTCCRDTDWLCKLLRDASVSSVTVERERRYMEAEVIFREHPSPLSISMIEEGIAMEFGLDTVKLVPVQLAGSAKKSEKKATSAPKEGVEVIMGKAVKGEPVPMRDVTLESGKVAVQGEVFDVGHKYIEKSGAWVLNFCITDNTGSLRISKFMMKNKSKYGRGEDIDPEMVCGKIGDGMYLKVSGNISYNRYDGDISLEPVNICKVAERKREDPAETGRVELHLHTRYSALDALTDPGTAVALAARWGHPAVAITDHGGAQSFPEACNAAKKHGIKLIYGIEGYYVNDYDERVAVSGACDWPLDGEFVAFDLETTGLSAAQDEIIEIGAVLCRGGEVIESFETYVDPGRPIPAKITDLTGIRDEQVRGAPGLAEALRDFFAFAGERPLVAHNAGFDMGFFARGCEKLGMPMTSVSVDTLVMAQSLLPDLKRHKLNLVAERLGLPPFRHHRALDDARTVAYILGRFIDMLRGKGLSNVSELSEDLRAARSSTRQSSRHARHIILLAKNQTGIRNLYKLISLSHLKHFKRVPIIPKSLLLENREGLIIGSACEAGELFSAALDGRSREELKRLAGFYDYLEIQPLCNNEFLLHSGKVNSLEELRNFNRLLVQIGAEMGKPVIATGDVHFLEPEDEIYRKILLAGKGFADADRHLPLYFKTTEEMLREFSYLGEEKAYEVVVENTRHIAEMCEELKPLPDGLFTPKIENSVEQLRGLVYDKLRALYGDNPPDIVKERVEVELADIIGCHYDVIYMSAQKLVARSLEAGYLVGSRGSVGSSIVAFLSGITEVNALPAHYRCPRCKHADFEAGAGYGCGADMPPAVCPVCGEAYEKDGFDIPFATFLGFGGDKIPDIDLNFSGEYQAEAHKYTNELFGADHVFRAGTIGTLASKTAYGYVKGYLSERGRVVTKAEENRLTKGCVGVKRTTGQHPGGLVVIPQDKEIYDFCPVQHPADDAGSGIITTHFEYHAMESNLLKLDLLGHDDPTMIKYLETLTGVDAKKIPLDDPDTMSIFTSPKVLGLPEDDPVIGKTGTIAVPEFGTKFTREMLVDTKPGQFDTLVRLSGFSHGTDVWLGNAKDLILSETATVKEVIGSRDDIMLFLISKGMDEKLAFKIMESVRKGRGLTDEWVKAMGNAGVPQWYIDSCNKIKYMFPKAHAVAYVMMAFRIAWFKVHAPLAFYSTYFTIRAKAFDAAYMTKGIDLVRAKINEIERNPEASNVEKEMLTTLEVCYEFYMRGYAFAPMELHRSDAVKFIIDGDRLIPPFTAIAGLGDTAAHDLAQHRSSKEFVSIEELHASCAKVSKTHIEQLKNAGALGTLPDTSQISLF